MCNNNFERIGFSAKQILKSLGQYLQLDLVYYLKGGAWLLLPQFLAYLLGVVRSIAFANLAAQAVYGQYNFILSIVGVFAIFTLPGMNIALTETVARGNYSALRYVTWIRIRWGVVSTFFCGLTSLYYLLVRGEDEIALAIFVAGLLLPFVNGFGSVQSYYNGRKKFNFISITKLGLSTLNTTLLLLLLWTQQGLIILVFVNSSMQLLFFFLFYWYEIRLIPTNDNLDVNVKSYGWSLTWANTINGMALYLDQIIIGFSIGYVELSIYKIATIIPEAIKETMKTTGTLIFPKIAENPDKRVYSSLTRHRLLYLLIFNLLVVIFWIIVVPLLITTIYPKYTDSILMTQLLLVTLSFGWPATFFLTALQARKKIRSIYFYNVLSGILQIGSLLVLIPFFGIVGAIFSRLVVRWGSTLYLWYEVRRL